MKLLEKSFPPLRQAGRAALPLIVALIAGGALVARVGLPLWARGSNDAVPGPQAAPAVATMAAKTDLALIRSAGLFAGDAAPAPTTAAALPALNTALNLRLEGVMLAGDGEKHQAVILGGTGRGSYRVGDQLPDAANITVASIARDHVIVDNRGQREVLWLYSKVQASAAAASPSGASALVSAGRAASVAGSESRNGNAAGIVPPPGTEERVAKTAARLAEIISVAPAVVNGQLSGYRLTPGVRLKEFVQLGFQTNDVVTAVNGIALNDVANLPKLYGLMDEATEVSFSLLRDGVPLQLKVTLDSATPASSP